MTTDRLHESLNPVTAERRQDSVRVPRLIVEGIARLTREMGERLESVVYYEHPLSSLGLLIVPFSDGEMLSPDLIARIYHLAHQAPLHCLRRWELFQLALPGFAAPGFSLDDQPHLAHCVKLRSSLLHGRDCRDEVPLPADLSIFLREHLRGCRKYFRTHCLSRLCQREYREVVGETITEARRLMSIAQIGAGGWRFDLAETPERFAAVYGMAEQTLTAWKRLEGLERCLETAPDSGKAAGYEALWLFDRFQSLLASEVLGTPSP